MRSASMPPTTLVLALLLATGCTGAQAPDEAAPSPTADASPTGDASPTAEPSPTADASPTAEPSPTTEPSPTAGDEQALGASCTNDELGLTVDYPRDWSTNDGGVLAACSLFDPGPIDVEPNTEIPRDLAVVLHGSDRQYATYADAGDEPGTRQLERRETTVAGHDAVAMLLEATEDAPLLEPGTRLYRWVVDLGVDEMTAVSTMLAVTYDEGEPDFEEKRRILDAMVQGIEFDRSG